MNNSNSTSMELKIIKSLSQPICLITKASKRLSYANPAMIRLINTSITLIELGETSFDDCFSIVQNTFDNLKSEKIDDEKPILLKVMNGQPKYYYGYFSPLNDTDLILLLTPCHLKKKVVENEFLRNHEQVVDFIENAPIGAHAFNSKGEIIYMNICQHKMLGFYDGEAYGKKMDDVSLMWSLFYFAVFI
jgi:hypothetical protein